MIIRYWKKTSKQRRSVQKALRQTKNRKKQKHQEMVIWLSWRETRRVENGKNTNKSKQYI